MLIPTIIFILYVVIMCLIYGIPDSISQTYLLLYKSRSILFSVIMMIISFSTLILTLSRTNDFVTIILTVIAIVGIIFVAIFAQYLDKFQKIFHFLGAGISALATIIWTFYIFKNEVILFIPLMTISIVIPIISNKRKLTFWAEIGCFVNYFIVSNLVYYHLI